ncbi:MAG TPA: zinc ribbon domain-containing protein [Candidatus Aminicenantes bacterium]|nr:zinc ribbon domain-containing protein [Candidatus Aminicenantes bacterium]
MLTYEYACETCGRTFEWRQRMTDAPLTACPTCGGSVHRLVSGGSGFIMRGEGSSPRASEGGCSLERTGRTCCGRSQRCGDSSCGEKP